MTARGTTTNIGSYYASYKVGLCGSRTTLSTTIVLGLSVTPPVPISELGDEWPISPIIPSNRDLSQDSTLYGTCWPLDHRS